MDAMVEAALKKWPNVPHCHGWLALDARGDWYMRDERIQRAGPFPQVKGSVVRHDKLLGFIQPQIALHRYRDSDTEVAPRYGRAIALYQRGDIRQALPLIEITAAIDVRPVHQAWRALSRYAAVMFVSANAVRFFFQQKPDDPGVGWPFPAIGTIAWATGPGTCRALQRAGLAPDRIVAPPPDAAQFDSEALWASVRADVRPGQRVLIVRGSDASGQGAGRDWLGDQLEGAGVAVERVLAYRRVAPAWGPSQRARARAAASDASWWLFSSSEAIDNLQRCLPDEAWGGARALATHPRIAARARAAGFGVVCESRPALAELMASIKSSG